MPLPFSFMKVTYKQRFNKIFYCTVANKNFSKKNEWLGVVGLEVHAQINTASKLFSASNASYGASVNTNVSLFDAALPGTLPVLNEVCVKSGILTALALNCKVNPVSCFDRKHYFYADLPAGYQITQQRAPLADNGCLHFNVTQPGINQKPYAKSCRIFQLQLEQDSGKSLHDDLELKSLIDLNRAGVPLMEIVFAPELRNGEEAACLVKELLLILTRLDTCLCTMEEGGLRVDVNVSVHRKGEPFGVRSEVKNIGSVRSVAKAVDYEIKRQSEILSCGGHIVNETRAWDPETAVTVPMRDKEETQDYRFMPEPNLPPLRLNMSRNRKQEDLISVPDIEDSIPELPAQTRIRLQNLYKLPSPTVELLVAEAKLLKLFEAIMEADKTRRVATVSNILMMELLTLVNKEVTILDHKHVTAQSLGEIVDLLDGGKINKITASRVLEKLVTGSEASPAQIVDQQGWTLNSNVNDIQVICEECYRRNSNLVQLYNRGKHKVFGAFLGDIARTTDNRINMEIASKIMKEILEKCKT